MKWIVKSYSSQIADTGDYDGYWEITNGKISLLTKDDGDDMEKILGGICNAINDTEINFYLDDAELVEKHFEIEGLKLQLKELQSPLPVQQGAEEILDENYLHNLFLVNAKEWNEATEEWTMTIDAFKSIIQKILHDYAQQGE